MVKTLRAAAAVLTLLLIVLCCLCFLPSQSHPEPEETGAQAASPVPEETVPLVEYLVPETTAPLPTEPLPAEPLHSPLYIPDLSVEDLILYFNEVCLDSEFVDSGDPSVVQKWTQPIYYTLEGTYTETDLAVLASFTDWLNTLEGFPGIRQTEDLSLRNLRICFCSRQEMTDLMGSQFYDMDGAVTFWYSDDRIYDAIICCRSDLDQELRNSVILEELYNGLGPIQDTLLRPDSIIYQEFSQPQALTPTDELILRLLYLPEIRPGMNSRECEQIIRSLYH